MLDSPAAGLGRTSTRRSLTERLNADAWGPIAATLAILLMVALTLLIVGDASIGRTPMAPDQPTRESYLNWLAGGKLSYYTFLPALLVIAGAYGVTLLLMRHVSRRWTIVAIVAMHVVVFIGPVMLSQDVFSYLAYARNAVLHGINPYLHGPIAAPHDADYRFVGVDWKKTLTAYGPLWTIVSYPIGFFGLDGGVWTMKVLGVVSSLGMVWLVWRCAVLRGRDPRLPAAIVGLSPITILYSVGGAHNDLEMAALMMLGVWLTLRDRDAQGAGWVVAGAAVKLTAAALLPFMFLGRRKRGPLIGAVVVAVGLGLFSLIVFGSHSLNLAATLRRQQSFVSSDSFPNEIAHIFGKPGVFPVDRTLLRLGLVIAVLYLLFITWRGYDWIAAGAWTMLAIVVTTTWLLAWYTMWALPLAVVGRDRRALWATLAVQAMFIVHQTSPLWSPRL